MLASKHTRIWPLGNIVPSIFFICFSVPFLRIPTQPWSRLRNFNESTPHRESQHPAVRSQSHPPAYFRTFSLACSRQHQPLEIQPPIGMKEAALAVTVACAVVVWRSSQRRNCRSRSDSSSDAHHHDEQPLKETRTDRSISSSISSGRNRDRPRKRVSFSEADNTVFQLNAEDFTDAERKELCWSPAELREFARSMRIDDWIEAWGS